MKVLKRTLRLFLLSLFVVSNVALSTAQSPQGEEMLAAVSDFVFASRRINFKTLSDTFTMEGSFVADTTEGYLKFSNGIELGYDNSSVTFYNSATNEYIIQPSESSGGDASNPFSLLKKGNKSIVVTEFKNVTANDGTPLVAITVTPKKKRAPFERAVIYVKGRSSDPSLFGIEITATGESYNIEVVSFTSPDPNLLTGARESLFAHAGAKVTDLTK